ncbi:hypothetical protein GCM10011391_28470 [Pullulanibacillus camelliae]|uniref:HTH cro/C1-type domain-containing protein n=1 Tax=Pullulanibacillus camelliae TaxID=1707096 RepID=A0A8J2YJL1_9BACL|nr:helix-turn-helix transcriptional regulator [Pullulanibacillus camelliae]GGE47990.1 hypothetical protein GCM10011391_28470 [Pullulanibacillus camelliae]
MELHEKIKAFRKSKGISQTFVAKALNLSVSGYNMKESGKRPITTSELQKISSVLGVSASIFFEEKFHVKLNTTA